MVNLKINLPPHFLDEEIRCGFTVSKELKEVWAVELDLLAEFDRVCKKIKYNTSPLAALCWERSDIMALFPGMTILT